MTETLAELVVKIEADAKDLKKALQDSEKSFDKSGKAMEKKSQDVRKAFDMMGKVMIGVGAAITASMGMMAKSAIDEEINIKRLSTTMKNVGVSYDKVKDSLEAVIATTQRKTGVADNEQRDILNRLILVTNDYYKALELLPTVLDLAAAGEMDATTAATYLGKAYLDLEKGAEKVSVRFGQASLQFKNMEDIQNRVKGAAEELVNPLNVIKASIGDTAEAIGSNLLPILKDVIYRIVDITEKIQKWTKENPELAKNITIVTTALGLVSILVGGLIIAIPKLVGAIRTLNAALIALGTTAKVVFATLTLITAAIISIVAVSQKLKEQWSEEVLSPIIIAWAKLGSEMENVSEAGRKTIEKHLKYTKKWSDTVAIHTKEEYDLYESLGYVMSKTEEYTKVVGYNEDAIQSQIDAVEDAIQSEQDRAKELSWLENAIRRVSDVEINLARKVHDEKVKLLDVEYNKKLKVLNAESDAAILAIQDQIDAINEQTEAENEALEDRRDQERLSELRARAQAEEDYDKYIELMAEAAELEEQINRKKLLRERDDLIESLRKQIDDIRKNNQKRQDELKENYNYQKELLDHQLDEELIRIDKVTEELMLAYGVRESETEDHINKINEITARLKDRIVTITMVTESVGGGGGRRDGGGGGGGIDGGGGGGQEVPWVPYIYPGTSFQAGGIVTQPTLGLLGEGGPEAVIPLNRMGGDTYNLNFTEPIFMEREDQMNRFVDKIYRKIQRIQRLRFGSAYGG